MLRIQFIVVALLIPFAARGQLTGNNLMEFRLGNLPYAEPRDLTTHYDQLNLQYSYRYLKAAIRYEHFYSQDATDSYNALTQYHVKYRKSGLEVEVGNFSGILGNGLLLRAYEIPGSVYESESYRVRYGFYRDLRGISAGYNGKLGYVKVLRGRTLANTFPPVVEEAERRPDLTEGAETGINFLGQTAGFILMRNTNGMTRESFYSLLYSGNISAFLSYNFELAHDLNRQGPLLSLGDESRYGIYASLNFTMGGFGLSTEFKDYHDLLIGAGISDPPTLVKEHKFKLLNRSIHIPQYYDESGVQLEAYYGFRDGTRLLLNYTRAVNEFSQTYVFSEYFAQLSFTPGSKSSVILFADYSEEPLKSEDHRYAGGFNLEYEISRRHSALLEVQFQEVERSLGGDSDFRNFVLIAGWSRSPSTSVTFTWEYSTDYMLTRGSAGRNWFGLDMSHKIDQRNTISLFAGQRRGGPACTSGICYEVLDFEGVELRLKTRF